MTNKLLESPKIKRVTTLSNMFNCQINFKDVIQKSNKDILEFQVRLPEYVKCEVDLEEFPLIERKEISYPYLQN